MNWDHLILIGWKVLAVLALVLLNGFFVATEFALVKVRQTQLDPLIARGNRRAKLTHHLIDHLDAYLSAAQLGITLASLALGWIGEPIFEDLLRPVFDWLKVESEAVRKSAAFLAGFTSITFLHIVAGEQAPKSFGIRQPLATALWVAYPLRCFYLVMYPFIWLLNESSLWLLRVLGLAPANEHGGAVSEEELRLMVASSQQHFGDSVFSRHLVQSALELRHRMAREVMRPRHEITVLDTGATLAECLELAEKTRFSRFPLCEHGDADKTLGVIHIKDLYAARQTAKTGADLRTVARKLVFVPETARLEKVLQVLLDRKLHMALVVDEFGGTQGIITLENILEELVGQIQDEFDAEKSLIAKVGENVWEIDGTLPLHELAELVGEELAGDGVTTASGWVTQHLGGFPKVGDKLAAGKCELRVEATDGTRVSRLKLTKPVEPTEPAAS